MAEKTEKGFYFDCKNCRRVEFVDLRPDSRMFQVFTIRCLGCGMHTAVEMRITIRETLIAPKPEEVTDE